MRIDFHTHVLPGIDDGSASVEESIGLLRLEAEQGVRLVAATPHFYPQRDTPDRFLERRAGSELRLREAMAGHTGLPELTMGAEVYYFPGISDSELVDRLAIGDGKCILIEMPRSPWTEKMYREIEGIYTKRGIIPVIAHVDRYIHPLRSYGIPERLERLPVYVQANASAFLRPATRNMALRMLRRGQIHILGSDCHNLTDRVPNMGAAARIIEKRLGPDVLDEIWKNGQALLGTAR